MRLLDIKTTEKHNGIPNCMAGMSVRFEITKKKVLRSSNKQHDLDDHGEDES